MLSHSSTLLLSDHFSFTSYFCSLYESYSFSLMLMLLVVFQNCINLRILFKDNPFLLVDTTLSHLLRIGSFKYYFIPLYFKPLSQHT